MYRINGKKVKKSQWVADYFISKIKKIGFKEINRGIWLLDIEKKLGKNSKGIEGIRLITNKNNYKQFTVLYNDRTCTYFGNLMAFDLAWGCPDFFEWICKKVEPNDIMKNLVF